jgi:capsular exopolysaccharide synthesis family protein
MGRVYRALVKADKWKDRAHPIGRPASYTPASYADAAPVDSGALGVSKEAADHFVADASHDGAATDYAGHFDAAMREGFEFEAGPPESEPFAISQALALSRHLYVAQSVPVPVPAVPVFVEPNRSANLTDLTVDPHLAALTGLDELAAERYRTLAVRLLNFAARRKLKSLLVTSAREAEGKTTVATNLAWVMAKSSERRVLLIDADLRNPSVSRMLGIKAGCDLLELAEGRLMLTDAAIRIDPNGLYVLASRAANADALASSRIESLLRELEQYFDFIIIDAPPIAEFADAQRLASIADGAMMVTRAGCTHHNAVTDALKLVPKERRLGVVLNEAQADEEIAYHSRKKQSAVKRFFAGKR